MDNTLKNEVNRVLSLLNKERDKVADLASRLRSKELMLGLSEDMVKLYRGKFTDVSKRYESLVNAKFEERI
jgi:hypothetical protein